MSDSAAPLSAGPLAAFRPAKRIIDETVVVPEAGYVHYSFNLVSDSRIKLDISANPVVVDVMLMATAQFADFKEAGNRPNGLQNIHLNTLSESQVLRMSKVFILSTGDWTIVVLRPNVAPYLGESSKVNMLVTAY